MRLVTERLVLRPVRPDDLDALHALLSDPRYMQYGATLPHTDLDQTRAWLEGMMAMTPEQGCDFIVEADGRAIGKCGVWRWPEIGYGLHPDYWGRGLAKEAITAVTEYIFAAYADLAEITAEVDPCHETSIRLLNGLGFIETDRKERNFLLGDQWVGTAYFSLARPGG